MSGAGETVVPIRVEADVVVARRTVRDAATRTGFGVTDTTRIVTAASELARNIIKYAHEGEMFIRTIEQNGPGIELEFSDRGPGIPDVDQAMAEGYSTTGGLGMGLPGARKLMDEMRIHSTVGRGTTIVVRKWRRR
jgi:serine/threonine-protein kinase RsbT